MSVWDVFTRSVMPVSCVVDLISKCQQLHLTWVVTSYATCSNLLVCFAKMHMQLLMTCMYANATIVFLAAAAKAVQCVQGAGDH